MSVLSSLLTLLAHLRGLKKKKQCSHNVKNDHLFLSHFQMLKIELNTNASEGKKEIKHDKCLRQCALFLCDVKISHRNNMAAKTYLCNITFDQFDCCCITAEGWSISNYLEQSQVYTRAGPLHCVQGKDIICKYRSIAFLIWYLTFWSVFLEKGNTNLRHSSPLPHNMNVWSTILSINNVDPFLYKSSWPGYIQSLKASEACSVPCGNCILLQLKTNECTTSFSITNTAVWVLLH